MLELAFCKYVLKQTSRQQIPKLKKLLLDNNIISSSFWGYILLFSPLYYMVGSIHMQGDLKQDQKDMYKKMVTALNTDFIVAFNKVDVIEPNTYTNGCTINDTSGHKERKPQMHLVVMKIRFIISVSTLTQSCMGDSKNRRSKAFLVLKTFMASLRKKRRNGNTNCCRCIQSTMGSVNASDFHN